MAAVNRVPYLDTDHTSADIRKCEMSDGEYSSSVDENEKLTRNTHSDFGRCRAIQDDPTEGTMKIYMNNRQHVFAGGKARENPTPGKVSI